ncbi:hypothetical protein GQ600_23771 [Phytophthora cactorum]|nr:hypothetical protein GQ600_23771 [Phytophthora cactorum]
MPNATPWSPEEDHGPGRNAFLDRIHQTYTQLEGDDATSRKTGALQSRWLIRPDVALYASCVAVITAAGRTRTTPMKLPIVYD